MEDIELPRAFATTARAGRTNVSTFPRLTRRIWNRVPRKNSKPWETNAGNTENGLRQGCKSHYFAFDVMRCRNNSNVTATLFSATHFWNNTPPTHKSVILHPLFEWVHLPNFFGDETTSDVENRFFELGHTFSELGTESKLSDCHSFRNKYKFSGTTCVPWFFLLVKRIVAEGWRPKGRVHIYTYNTLWTY